MGIRYGGETNRDLGLRMTVDPVNLTITTAAPVEKGDLFKLGGTDGSGNGYAIAELIAGDDPVEVVMVSAAERKTADTTPMDVYVISPGYSQVRRFKYKTGAAPTLGQSVESATAAVRRVTGISYVHGKGFVLRVDTANEEVEVLC